MNRFPGTTASSFNKRVVDSLYQLCLNFLSSHLDDILANKLINSRILPFELRLQLLRQMAYITSQQIQWLFDKKPAQLQSLSLAHLPLSADIYPRISSFGSQLRHLDLTSCKFLTHEGLETVLPSCSLKRLSLGFTALQDQTLVELIANKPTIVELDIRGCSQLTDNGYDSCTKTFTSYLTEILKN